MANNNKQLDDWKVVDDWEEVADDWQVVDDWETEEPSLLSKAADLITTDQEEFTEAEMAQAQKTLEERGDPENTFGQTIADILAGAAFGASGGLVTRAQGEDAKTERAIQRIREERSPIAKTVGEIAGFLFPGAWLARPVKAASFSKSMVQGLSSLPGSATSTALAAGSEATRAAEGKELEAAAKDIAIGAALAGFGTLALAGGKAAGKKIGNEVSKRLGDTGLSPDVARELSEEAAKTIEESKQMFDEAYLQAGKLTDEQIEEMVKLDILPEFTTKVSDKAVNHYRDYLANSTAIKNFGAQEYKPLRNGILKLMDAQYVANYVDRRYGTTTAKTFQDLAEKYNQLSHTKSQWKKAFQQQVDEFPRTSKEIYDEIESTKLGDPLSQEAQNVVDYFEGLRYTYNQIAKKSGASQIPKLKDKHYIPHYTKDNANITKRLAEHLMKNHNVRMKDLTESSAEALMDDKQLIEALSYMQAKTVESPAELVRLLRNPGKIDPQQFRVPGSPKSGKKRVRDEVPELLREDDLALLANRWIEGSFSQAYLAKELKELQLLSQSFRGIDYNIADYFDNLAKDTMGQRRGLAGWTQDLTDSYRESMYRLAGETGNKNFEIAGDMPNLTHAAMMNMYPFFLGLRVDAVLRNTTQPIQQTIPYLGVPGAGGKYAAGLGIKAYKDTVKNYNEVVNKLNARGFMPADPTPQAWDALNKGIQQNSEWKKAYRRAKDKSDKLAMYLYTKSDEANRVVTYNIGEQLTKDFLANSKNAIKIVENMPPGIRRSVDRAKRLGDAEQVEQLIIGHLMSHTQFHYSRPAMSEFGRWAGGLFSMFSKWPTAILGDVVDNKLAAKYGNMSGGRAMQRMGYKYMFPLVGLTVAQQAYEDSGMSEDPRMQQILGKNLQAWSSATSLTPFIEGTIIQPPLFDVVQDPMRNGLSTIPGAVWIRGFNERVPKWLGEKDSVYRNLTE